MRIVPVRLERGGYDIRIGCEVGAAVGEVVRGLGDAGGVVVVVDENVARLHAGAVQACLGVRGVVGPEHVIRGGEGSKSVEELVRLWDRLERGRLGRDAALVALGGGVVVDLVGFAAATWMRGIRWVGVPTTLEAMIDASVGGKTGINRPGGKNMVGAFCQPSAVLNDLSFLGTLGERDLVAGLAESIKHALIGDEEFLGWQESHVDGILGREEGVMEELIARNCEIKAGVVERDEREERGIRECLNFGHTVGHAIEKAAEYALRHGECVGLGMLAALKISAGRGMISERIEERVRALMERVGLPVKVPEEVSKERIMELMGADKKARGGRVRFVLLEGVGAWKLVGDVGEREIEEGIGVVE